LSAKAWECGKIWFFALQDKAVTATLEFTGERFTPECVREIWYEHFHRYALAAYWCTDQRTLDAACGEGYGSAMLADSAASVEAVDISEQAIEHARERYGHIDELGFHQADCTRLPFADDEFDRVVSFETLEHLAEQDGLMAEFKRVLKADGCLILSSPDKAVYSDKHGSNNEFHVKELYREELDALIGQYFPVSRLLGQKLMFYSAIWSLGNINRVTLDQVSAGHLTAPGRITQRPMYYIALCAATEADLPQTSGQLYLFDDWEESVYQHYQSEIGRNMAAGGIIAGLEKQVRELQASAGSATSSRVPWWRRLLGKS